MANGSIALVAAFCSLLLLAGVALAACTDSDGGISYDVAGVYVNGQTALADGCISNKLLREYYCNDENPASNYVDYTCPGTCSAGRCVAPAAPVSCAPNCIDKTCGSDGCGGTCGSCGTGMECSSGRCVTVTPPCDGCFVNGRCVQIGYRFSYGGGSTPSFCDFDGIIPQKVNLEGSVASCSNNFACSSNLCSNGQCVEVEGMQAMFVSVFCKLFNLIDNTGYERCLSQNLYGVGYNDRINCGDGFCQRLEEVMCPQDCDPTCTEDWACTDWSACADGVQTRVCTDNNNCGTTHIRPGGTQSCTVPSECAGAHAPCETWSGDIAACDNHGCQFHENMDCTGEPHACSAHNYDDVACAAAGCIIGGCTDQCTFDERQCLDETTVQTCIIPSNQPAGQQCTQWLNEPCQYGICQGGSCVVIQPCDNNGICDPGETRERCPDDCAVSCSTEGQTCAGIAGIQCCPGFVCNNDLTVADSDGICVARSYVISEDSITYINGVPDGINVGDTIIFSNGHSASIAVLSGNAVSFSPPLSPGTPTNSLTFSIGGIGTGCMSDDDCRYLFSACMTGTCSPPDASGHRSCIGGYAPEGTSCSNSEGGSGTCDAFGTCIEKLCEPPGVAECTNHFSNTMNLNRFECQNNFRCEGVSIGMSEFTYMCMSDSMPDNSGCAWHTGARTCQGMCLGGTCYPILPSDVCKLCGDGTVDYGEECDDGNTIDGDGCSSTCQTESYCGDAICSNEDCSSCPADCGPCCTQVCDASTCGQSICGTQCPPCGCDNAVASALTNFLAFFGLMEPCPPACSAGQISCGGTCTDTNSDPSNCGSCGSACTSGQTCSAGSCGGGEWTTEGEYWFYEDGTIVYAGKDDKALTEAAADDVYNYLNSIMPTQDQSVSSNVGVAASSDPCSSITNRKSWGITIGGNPVQEYDHTPTGIQKRQGSRRNVIGFSIEVGGSFGGGTIPPSPASPLDVLIQPSKDKRCVFTCTEGSTNNYGIVTTMSFEAKKGTRQIAGPGSADAYCNSADSSPDWTAPKCSENSKEYDNYNELWTTYDTHSGMSSPLTRTEGSCPSGYVCTGSGSSIDCVETCNADNCQYSCCPDKSGNGKEVCVDTSSNSMYCGSCDNQCYGEPCVDGQCETCTPDCAGKMCGDDGCGGSCGECPTDSYCDNGQCQNCVPNCAGKQCGDDGCGGTCGGCDSGWDCVSGTCQPICVPDCNGKYCGEDDGCGGTCTACLDPTKTCNPQTWTCEGGDPCTEAVGTAIAANPIITSLFGLTYDICNECPGGCDDGNACTTDSCSSGSCQHDAVNCDDGNACNGAETCDPSGGCQPGTSPNCDDGNPCTDDSCVPSSGCVNAPNGDPSCGGGGGGCEGSSDPCCGNPDPCCGSSDPCCGSTDPCCGSSDPCCGSTDPCCGSTDPCCGSSDPACGSNPCDGVTCGDCETCDGAGSCISTCGTDQNCINGVCEDNCESQATAAVASYFSPFGVNLNLFGSYFALSSVTSQNCQCEDETYGMQTGIQYTGAYEWDEGADGYSFRNRGVVYANIDSERYSLEMNQRLNLDGSNSCNPGCKVRNIAPQNDAVDTLVDGTSGTYLAQGSVYLTYDCV